MDRVSNLPDEVRCHILSFLPTKHAALTSVLSKSWLNQWKLVPNLDIDDSEFLHPEEGKGERHEIRRSFVDFVDSVLAMQGDSPIEKFSLKCITGVHPDCVNRWICNVLQRGVSDLNLFIDFSDEDTEEDTEEDDYRLPQEMFGSKTLVKLKIRSEHCVNWWHWDMGASLPMLKSLYIDSKLIFWGEMESFLPSFPVLEELRMVNMEWTDSDETVSSASLRKLSIHGTGSEDFENPKSISFDTPSLLYLNYSDLVAEDYPLVNMGKLFEARINLIVKNEDQIKRVRAPNNELLEDDEDDVVLQFGHVVKLMNGIQNIQKLYLTSDTLEVLSLCCESMPVFNNLKILGIKSDEGRGWQAVPALLRICPHLEFLIIEGLLHYVTDKCGDACDCMLDLSREDKGRSLTSCPVKKLDIQGFRGTMREINMIGHFLRSFRCLKEMRIFAEENGPTNFENPGVVEYVEKILHLYNELSSCDVYFLVCGFMRRKWTDSSSRPPADFMEELMKIVQERFRQLNDKVEEQLNDKVDLLNKRFENLENVLNTRGEAFDDDTWYSSHHRATHHEDVPTGGAEDPPVYPPADPAEDDAVEEDSAAAAAKEDAAVAAAYFADVDVEDAVDDEDVIAVPEGAVDDAVIDPATALRRLKLRPLLRCRRLKLRLLLRMIIQGRRRGRGPS